MAGVSARRAPLSATPRLVRPHAVVVGAGPVGCAVARLLAVHGYAVDMVERRPDPRRHGFPWSGRTINLSISPRGLASLAAIGCDEALLRVAVPMDSRIIHSVDGDQKVTRYEKSTWRNYSVPRNALNQMLLDRALEHPAIRIRFTSRCSYIDHEQQTLIIEDETGRLARLHYDLLVGADGAHSTVRQHMVERGLLSSACGTLSSAYKELTLRPRQRGLYRSAIHVWPRDGFFLVALPDAASTFKCTLVLPREGGAHSFAALSAGASLDTFVHEYFPDVEDSFVELQSQYKHHPVARITTALCDSSHWQDSVVLVGDAAHTVAPFLGQGVNLGFEDCLVLHQLLGDYSDRTDALTLYSRDRTINGAAAASLSMDNYNELTISASRPMSAARPHDGASARPPAPILVNFYGLSYSEAYARLHARPEEPASSRRTAGTYVRPRGW